MGSIDAHAVSGIILHLRFWITLNVRRHRFSAHWELGIKLEYFTLLSVTGLHDV